MGNGHYRLAHASAANLSHRVRPKTSRQDIQEMSIDLSKIVGGLAGDEKHHVAFYRDGAIQRKPFAEVYRDIKETVERLRRAGVRAGMRVGLLAPNSYEWIVYDLALIELRCQILALPPDQFVNESLVELGDRFDLSLLLLSAQNRKGAPADASWITYLDAEAANPARARERSLNLADEEYEEPSLIFSSGTSGKLKCLVTSRRGGERLIARYRELYKWGETDSMLIFLPLSNYQQRLLAYSAFWVPHDLYLVDPVDLMRGLKEMRPTMFIAPPIFFEGLEKRLRLRSKAKRLVSKTVGAVIEYVWPKQLRGTLKRRHYRILHEMLGGRLQLILTGMAPIRRSTLDFFNHAGLPIHVVYSLNECGTVSVNTPERNRVGSVGLPFEAEEISLRDDGEIIVRKEHPLTHRYLFVDAEEAQATYLDAHTVATGDIGHFDRDGYLYLIGRKKEIIVTSGGVKIHPETVEARLDEFQDISRSAVFGTDLPYLAAIISYTGPKNAEVEQRVQAFVERVNQRAASPAEWVGKLVFTNLPFAVENAFLTRNLKLSRAALFKHFEKELKSD